MAASAGGGREGRPRAVHEADGDRRRAGTTWLRRGRLSTARRV